MFNKTHLTLLFISLISFVYVLRDTNISPGTLLRKSLSRALDAQDITNALCQNLQLNVTVTASEQETANDHTSSYTLSNPLVTFIEGPDPSGQIFDDYIKPVATKAAFFAVFIILSVGSFIYYTTVWCCVTFGMCRKFTICKGPKASDEHKTTYSVITGVLMLGMFITGIVGAADSTAVKNGGNQLVCSVAVLAEKTLEGSNSENWLGVEVMVTNMQTILNAWPSVSFELAKTPTLTGTTLGAQVSTLYKSAQVTTTTFKQSTILTVSPRPDPSKGEGLYTPTYVTVQILYAYILIIF